MITKAVMVGAVQIGAGAPISVQTMTTTDTCDIIATAQQINRLNCDIVRVAAPSIEAAKAIYELKNKTNIPIVADVHFDYRIALSAIEAGADKLRINPGNMDFEHLKLIAKAARIRKIPIRCGVNSGSVPKSVGKKTGVALCEFALECVTTLHKCDFEDIVISVKASHVPTMVEAYTMLSERTQHPLHLGVTESGTLFNGLINSAAGIGSLLLKGIGDTIRVSLTADPAEEVRAAKALLVALDLRQGARLICCPTCGRCGYDLFAIAKKVERELMFCDKKIKVAVMGCVVNGPGEAKDADIGIAGGTDGKGVLFRKGKAIATGVVEDLVSSLIEFVREF